jgi:putative FmdB family regulatory protein
MPIFEYVCSACGHKFEKLVLSSRRAREISCPECGSVSVDKALSSFGVSGGGSASLGSASNCAPSG